MQCQRMTRVTLSRKKKNNMKNKEWVGYRNSKKMARADLSQVSVLRRQSLGLVYGAVWVGLWESCNRAPTGSW